MNDQDLVNKSREILQRLRQLPAKSQLQSLIDKGVIDENGQVVLRGDFNAFLAVVAVKSSSNGNRITHFRCLKPAFGLPGAAEIDISRQSLIDYLRDGKRVITALLDKAQNRWREGAEVHLTSQDFVRTDRNDSPEDNLGELPKFQSVRSHF